MSESYSGDARAPQLSVCVGSRSGPRESSLCSSVFLKNVSNDSSQPRGLDHSYLPLRELKDCRSVRGCVCVWVRVCVCVQMYTPRRSAFCLIRWFLIFGKLNFLSTAVYINVLPVNEHFCYICLGSHTVTVLWLI